MLRTSLLLAGVVLLSSCASLTPQELSLVQSRGVPAPVVAKLQRDAPLSPPDIITLSQRGTPDWLIIRSLERGGVNYLLNKKDVQRLRQAGVSSRVIEALLLECERFARQSMHPDVETHIETNYNMWWMDADYYGPSSYYEW